MTGSAYGTSHRRTIVEDRTNQINGLWIIPDISSYGTWSTTDLTKTASSTTDIDIRDDTSRSINATTTDDTDLSVLDV